MDIEYMRNKISEVYDGSWKNKVLQMSDKQVFAIYKSFQEKKKFEEKKKKKTNSIEEQIHISELLSEDDKLRLRSAYFINGDN